MKIAFLGLGQMGRAIAVNLIDAGHTVTVWNRSEGRAASLGEAGAIIATTPRDAVEGAETVFTMLADDKAVTSVVNGTDGLLAGLGPDAIHVGMSTVGVGFTDDLAAQHIAMGRTYIAAPVFGRPDAAAAARLFVLAGGDANAIDRCRPLFDVIGQRLFIAGPKPSHASVVKLSGNFMIMAAVEAMAESMALCEANGVARGTFLDVIQNTLFNAPVYRNYGAMLAEERYRPAGFGAPLGLKDMRLVDEAAEVARVAMPSLGVIRNRLRSAIAAHGEDIDWAGIALAAKPAV
jgi:3-hydroxyisobutyrate dehydrogenase-like beta-hydroxyacid dehydrogenase